MRFHTWRIAALILAVSFAGVAIWQINFAQQSSISVLNPATGYEVPSLAEVESIRVTEYTTGNAYREAFKIPSEYWEHLLDTLSPSERRPDVMAIPILAVVHVNLSNGEQISITLFSAVSSLFFRVGTPNDDQFFYAGDRLSETIEVLEAARLNAARLVPESRVVRRERLARKQR